MVNEDIKLTNNTLALVSGKNQRNVVVKSAMDIASKKAKILGFKIIST